MTCTSVCRNKRQTAIEPTIASAILTTVQRKSSRCSRNGFEVSLSGRSRNLKISRRAMIELLRRKRDQSAGSEAGADRERVGVANFVFRDHPAEFTSIYPTTLQNCLALFPFVDRSPLDGADKEKIAKLVRQPR